MDSKKFEVEASSFDSELEFEFIVPNIAFEEDSIFKYGSFKYLERTLADNSLKFNSISNYNDPFEIDYAINLYMDKSDQSDHELINNYDFNKNGDSDKLWQAVERRERLIKEIRSFANDYFSQYILTCFSKSPLISLMWSHYADDHNGICYCFKRDLIFDSSKFKLGSIIYSSELPQLSVYKHSDFKYLRPQLFNIMLTKSLDWSYEKEIRCFTEKNNTSLLYNPCSLQSIILGSRMSDGHRDKVKDLVHKYNEEHQTDVKVWCANKSITTYEMAISDINTKGSYYIKKMVFNN